MSLSHDLIFSSNMVKSSTHEFTTSSHGLNISLHDFHNYLSMFLFFPYIFHYLYQTFLHSHIIFIKRFIPKVNIFYSIPIIKSNLSTMTHTKIFR